MAVFGWSINTITLVAQENHMHIYFMAFVIYSKLLLQ